MDVYTCKPSKLFAGPIRYSVLPYQRGYVWEEAQQWEPLMIIPGFADSISRKGSAVRIPGGGHLG